MPVLKLNRNVVQLLLTGFYICKSLSLLPLEVGELLPPQVCPHYTLRTSSSGKEVLDKWPQTLAQPSSLAYSPPSPPSLPRASVTQLGSTGWATSWCTSSPAGRPTLCVWSYKTGKATRPMPSMSISSWAVRSSCTGGLGAQAGGWAEDPWLVTTDSAPRVNPWAFPVPTICPPFGHMSQDLEAAG